MSSLATCTRRIAEMPAQGAVTVRTAISCRHVSDLGNCSGARAWRDVLLFAQDGYRHGQFQFSSGMIGA